MSSPNFNKGRSRPKPPQSRSPEDDSPTEPKGMLKMLDPRALALVDELQPRLAVDEATVGRYEGLMSTGDSKYVVNPRGERWPAIHVVEGSGEELWVVDGFHRALAARRAGLVAIQARVWRGTYRDALERSLRANATNGLPRSDGDFGRAMERALGDDEWGRMSDRQLARLLGTSHTTVQRWRKKLADSGDVAFQTERRGADGKTYTAKGAPGDGEKLARKLAPWRAHKRLRAATIADTHRALPGEGGAPSQSFLYEVPEGRAPALDLLERASASLGPSGTLTVAVSGPSSISAALELAAALSRLDGVGEPRWYTASGRWLALVFPHAERRTDLPEQGSVSFHSLLKSLGDVTRLDHDE